jgi:adenosylhomocysteine nucleosidase
MKKILVIAALDSEYFSSKSLKHSIIYSGVGKINASRVTTRAVIEYQPEIVVNVGTAGSLRKDLSGLYIVRDVIEHDMNAEPLALRGSTPFDPTPNVLSSDIGDVRCATGDSFVTEIQPWLIDNQVDLVDMELFAIAKVCHTYNIPWRSMKYVSDYVDKDSASSWTSSLSKASIEISEAIEKLFV